MATCTYRSRIGSSLSKRELAEDLNISGLVISEPRLDQVVPERIDFFLLFWR